jgi:hypothetical protein
MADLAVRRGRWRLPAGNLPLSPGAVNLNRGLRPTGPTPPRKSPRPCSRMKAWIAWNCEDPSVGPRWEVTRTPFRVQECQHRFITAPAAVHDVERQLSGRKRRLIGLRRRLVTRSTSRGVPEGWRRLVEEYYRSLSREGS